MKPGGRLVLSNMRPDADVSKLYLEGIDELRSGRAREVLGEDAERALERSSRTFLNDAARILDLEEDGTFHFWDAAHFQSLAQDAGFVDVTVSQSFGDPPQALVLSARKP